jgi:hypothetical protein
MEPQISADKRRLSQKHSHREHREHREKQEGKNGVRNLWAFSVAFPGIVIP